MNFEAVIGLEIHVEMKTKSKMFSGAPVSFAKEPNSEVTFLDMGFPGTMPSVNKEAVINAIRVAHALHMEIDRCVRFDRKNYFYADLPKGYQITQQFHPIGKNGYLDIEEKNGEIKRIPIERIHMEEDTCKQLHFPDCTLLDYNRAGVPLVEIVSLPAIRNGYEAMKYVEGIRNIVVYSNTSDGKMEEGSLRCDVNISLRPYGQKEFGTKVEIKNLNSLKNIQEAIDYEAKRQASILLSGGFIQQETRRFDENSGKTVLMRVKTDAVDYKYFPEPNITPIILSEEFVSDAIKTCPELYDAKKARFLAKGLSENDVEIILANPSMASFFDQTSKENKNAKIIANFLIVEINAYLNKKNLKIEDLSLEPSKLGEIANYQAQGLTHKQCADILNWVLEKQIEPQEAKKELKIVEQVRDEETLLPLVQKIIEDNQQSVNDYLSGKDRALGYLVGQAMKVSRGKANPAIVSKLIIEEIKKKA